MFYFVKTPWLLKKLYSRCTWHIPSREKTIYLTFDDGPHPTVTPYVLDVLQQYKAKATFFCIGKNVVEHPAIYRRILDEGHRTGNHTHNHLNGWKVKNDQYINNIIEAAKHIDSNLFRPPYGRITQFQVKILSGIAAYKGSGRNLQIIMWDVLSGDFDQSLSAETCTVNVINKTRPGSIVVFHDSEKAFPRMKDALPRMLKYFSGKGFRFEVIQL
ncbi:polysaccharide deacetylase family protein [Pseudoflavitalea sp. X16]|uniref:polysaccharide deacetylase family protein n=1 Tax=Paraflavitalea devenefica TaxID=2716334 RepID=UPI0014213452|nr:polysaccharide deacetylase family protein [Paraflavitalea devenefica]NII23842.1 polysaccharide deacetylase family protein [Paraflavitalea devenefica]